jgi:hypothetical protein
MQPTALKRAAACLAAGGAAAGLALADAPPAGADVEYAPTIPWNGYRVYLSPARHADSGSRGECYLEENVNGFLAANNATNAAFNGDHDNLRDRGYKVRIGNGTVSSAIANSNSWGADLHIPLHSNARDESCGNTTASVHGTWGIHEGNLFDELLVEELVQWVGTIDTGLGQRSPGTNDVTCRTADCTNFDSLGEIRETNAVSGYLELEFHTWQRGADYLANANRWSWRIAAAVDQFLDYPR